ENVQRSENVQQPENPQQPQQKKPRKPELKPLIPGLPVDKSPKYFPFQSSPDYQLDKGIVFPGIFIDIIENGLGIMLSNCSEPPQWFRKEDLEYLRKFDKDAWKSCRQ